jgi:hypothetical protein
VVIETEEETARAAMVESDFWATAMAAKSMGGGRMAAEMGERESVSATTFCLPGMWIM